MSPLTRVFIYGVIIADIFAVVYFVSLLLRTQLRMSPQAAGMVGVAVAVSQRGMASLMPPSMVSTAPVV